MGRCIGFVLRIYEFDIAFLLGPGFILSGNFPMEDRRYPTLPAWGSILLGTLWMMYYAFHNGFPLVYPDTGAYIYSGMEFEMPWDRSLFYGWFVRHISLRETLWLPVMAQAWFVSWATFVMLKHFGRVKKGSLPFWHLGLIVFLVLFSSASSFASFIMPDIFIALAILAWTLLLFADKLNWKEVLGLSILFWISHGVHNSHLIIGLGILFVMSIYMLVWGRKNGIIRLQRFLIVIGLTALSWITVLSLNYASTGEFVLSKGGTPFMMSHLVEIGVVEEYLDEKCEDGASFKICAYKDKIPVSFLWDYEKSPPHLTGGWEANEEEYQQIINEIFSTPKYVKVFLYKSVIYTVKQFFTIDTGDAPNQGKGSVPRGVIKDYMSKELREYDYGLQHGRGGSLRWQQLNNRQHITIMISYFVFFLLMFHPKVAQHISPRTRAILTFLMLGLLANAAVCGTFSVVIGRYQSRVIWLLPLVLSMPLTEWLASHERWRKWLGLSEPETNAQ